MGRSAAESRNSPFSAFSAAILLQWLKSSQRNRAQRLRIAAAAIRASNQLSLARIASSSAPWRSCRCSGPSTVWKAAENYPELRRRGITVRKTIDGIIASACNCFAEA